MAEPITSTVLTALGKRVGEMLAPKLIEWAKGSEPQRLVKLLKRDHPAAPKMLMQPSVLEELWRYSTTGELREDALLRALRPIVDDERERRALVVAIRETQWQVVRDERQQHHELQRLNHEIKQALAREKDELLVEIEAALDRRLERLRPRLAVVRGLPAEVDPFVDRDAELAEAERRLAGDGAGEQTGARLLSCSGMPGVGSSALGLRLAHRHVERFAGGALYANFRRSDGAQRPPEEVAAQLLREVGVAPEVIPAEPAAQLALLRSLLAQTPYLLLLDNVQHEDDVRPLVPANSASAVVATSAATLAGLGSATLIVLAPLGDADGLALLRRLIGARVEREPEAAETIVRACHGLPLALSLAGARLRRRPHLRLADYAAVLADERRRVAHLADRERALSATFAASTRGLGAIERRLLLLLAALDVGAMEPSLCAALLDGSHAAASVALERLEAEGLLMAAAGGRLAMHELLRLWAREQAACQLEPGTEASARERMVRWLVEEAQARRPDTSTED